MLAHRLVTLLGPGGSGKTRLGVEVAQALRTRPPATGGAIFVRIAFVPPVTCREAVQVADAIARALRLPAGSPAATGAADAPGAGGHWCACSLGGTQAEALWAEGAAMDVTAAVALALA